MRKKSVGSLNDYSTTSRQSVYQRGRNGSPNYVLLYSDDEDAGEEEDIPLEPRKLAKTAPRQVEVIKVVLKAEDTLQALSLRYQCTISELKRINNIHKENEIFAHRYIKVPVQPFSIFTETLVDYEGASTSGENDVISGQQSQSSASRDEQLINLIAMPIVPPTVPQTRDINDIILNSVCESLTKSVNCESTSIAEESETEQLLSSNEVDQISTSQPTTIDSFKCSGADWGLSWGHLLGVSLLLGFAGPLIYILYIAEEKSEVNSH